MKAAESSTNALASASGLSRTMAICISPPSFWIRPVGRLASVQGSQLPCFRTMRSHSSGLSVTRCQFVVGHGVPSARMKGLSGSVEESRSAIAALHGMSLPLLHKTGLFFCPMTGSESAHSCRSVSQRAFLESFPGGLMLAHVAGSISTDLNV